MSTDENDRTERRTCGAVEQHRELIETDEEYRHADEQIERFTEAYVGRKRERGEGLRGHVVTIPVVVHVVYNDSTQNISQAQIQSQIDVLNEDFRANNPDVTSVPTEFEPVVADARIEFELANRDPQCQPTNGITRTQTDVGALGPSDVKSDATGGQDGWPPEEYLNIWVCPLSGNLLGQGTFPAQLSTNPDEDGVVINYEAFGTTGTASAPFDRGRTGTHEVGHWLNLLHIWDRSGCGNDDNVADTPTQDDEHYDCPSHPTSSCGSNDMFMNYMDYVDDSCMYMFTAGQSDRMEAALFGPRSEIVGSDALLPPSGQADLWMQDTPVDRADEPNTQSSVLYRSHDIWVRNTSDGLDHQQHQNPVYRMMGDKRNYVYVRVRCDGCTGSESGTLKLYWAKASAGLSWPKPWDGSVTSPELMGEMIGSQSTGSIQAGDHQVFEFPWVPPNPADYAGLGGDKGHFCLLARIETDSSPPYGMTFPEGSNLSENVRQNNNIAWKNVSITTETSSGGRTGSVLLGGVLEEEFEMRLQVDFDQETEFVPLLRRGRVHVSLSDDLYERWAENGFEGEGVEPVQDGFLLVRPSGWIGDFDVEPGTFWPVDVTFEPRDELDRTELAFVELTQQAVDDGETEVIGGQQFVIGNVGELDRAEIEPAPEIDQTPFQQWLEDMFAQSLDQLDTRSMEAELTNLQGRRRRPGPREDEG